MIECVGISKYYSVSGEKITALEDINFKVREGEFVAITGKSGSGKSTLMNVLGCLDTASKGSFLLNGKNIFNLKPSALSHLRSEEIGFVFQSFNLLPSLTALENVTLPLIYREMPISKCMALAQNALREVNMTERKNHLPSQLSGGQQQRVSVARATVGDPKIILADEPTGNLDPQNSREVLDILKKLSSQGKIVLMVTHDTNIANAADRVIRLSNGKIDYES